MLKLSWNDCFYWLKSKIMTKWDRNKSHCLRGRGIFSRKINEVLWLKCIDTWWVLYYDLKANLKMFIYVSRCLYLGYTCFSFFKSFEIGKCCSYWDIHILLKIVSLFKRPFLFLYARINDVREHLQVLALLAYGNSSI